MEVKVMEEIFDQMNDEVDQNTIDKQCAEIVKKNLLIENENLIANCLSNQLLYDLERSRYLDLEAEMSRVHNESKHISKLEREYLNLQLKNQHLQENFDNNKSQTSQKAPDFNSFFKIKNLEHHIQEKDNMIRDLKVLVSNVNDRSCEPYNANDVTDLLEQNECFRAEIEKIEDLKAQLEGNLKVATRSSVKTKVPCSWIPTGKKFTTGKLNCGYQWRPTGKKFALGELYPLTRLLVTCTTMSANRQDPTQIGSCSKLDLKEWMAHVRISSGLKPIMTLDLSNQVLNLASQMSQRRLLASLQASFLKDKKVVKWINIDQLIGKGNLLLDLQKLQKNPIFRISVDILQNTNYVRAFTTSANVPSIYILLFWNTLTHDAKTRVYSFQVDEHGLTLSADLFRKALNVTPAD
ncbi:hypothetical protein Tco_1046560 [Tanacetum coccineum]